MNLRDYHRSRPYHLVPWLVLAAAAALWPPRVSHAPGMSEDRCMSPQSFDAAEPGRGRAAKHPHEIPLLGWRDIVWRLYRETMRDRIPVVAGGITFHLLLALFPAIGAFVSLYGLFADIGAVQRQLLELSVVFPQSVVQIIGEQMLRLAGQHQVLVDGLNVAYDEEEKRAFFRRTALTYAATFGAVVFITVITAVLIAAPIALRELGVAAIDSWWVALRWLAVFGLTVFGFTLAYRYGPSRARAQWRWVTWGAVFAAALWLGGSLAFSWYVNNVANLDATYGPLGAVIAFMLWVWFSVMVLLTGAELNAEIEHQTAIDTTTGPEEPMGQRGAVMADTVGKPLPMTPREAIRWTGGFVKRVVSRSSLRGKPAAPPDPRRSEAR
jgi:membrane protein